jgi:trans-aconitate methyltransferase
MQNDAPPQPRRFTRAAAHYRGGRPPYAPALIRQVAHATGLQPQHRVLDLGCGPGSLAIGFGYFAGEVLGLDPEPAMLQAAVEAARGLVPNVSFRRASSHDLSPALGRFRLVTMGRSFHWMDREDTLRRLDSLLDPGGAIALFRDSHPDLPDNAWRKTWREIIDKYDSDDTLRNRRRSQHWVRHEAVLIASPFCVLETHAVIERRTITTESLVDRALSMSSTSQDRIGEKLDDLVSELRAFSSALSPDGYVDEIVESAALVARRLGE